MIKLETIQTETGDELLFSSDAKNKEELISNVGIIVVYAADIIAQNGTKDWNELSDKDKRLQREQAFKEVMGNILLSQFDFSDSNDLN